MAYPPALTVPSPSPSPASGTPGGLAATGDPLSLIRARYQQEQKAIGRQVTHVVRRLWDAYIHPEQFSASWYDISPDIKGVIGQHYRASAASASRFYRNTHHIDGHGLVRVTPSALDRQYLSNLCGSLANGSFYHQLNKQKLSPSDASVIARNLLSGAAARFALMGGRDTVIGALPRDPHARGWEYVLDADACSYCSMYAARGPYKAKDTKFHSHDYCHCVAQPVYHTQAPLNAALSADWAKVTKGKSGSAARAAWEEYWR
jgi:hypothetical protein